MFTRETRTIEFACSFKFSSLIRSFRLSLSLKLTLVQKVNEFGQRCFKGNESLSFRCLIIPFTLHWVVCPEVEVLTSISYKPNWKFVWYWKYKTNWKKKLLTPGLIRRSIRSYNKCSFRRKLEFSYYLLWKLIVYIFNARELKTAEFKIQLWYSSSLEFHLRLFF